MNPEVSVIIVSDRASGAEQGWADLRATLLALACQDFDGTVEYILMNSTVYAAHVPEALTTILPGMKVVTTDAASSYVLKNEGAKHAQADIIGVLDGDCAPAPGWLRHAVAVFRDHPDAAVVSGRTIYDSVEPRDKALGLLARGYLDKGEAGWTGSIANNNAVFRRDALLAHVFLDDIGPFGGTLQRESMQQAGLGMYFEPGMLAAHTYDGWGMEQDYRINAGFATIAVRRVDPRIEFSWMTRLGYLSMVLFVTVRMACSFWSLATLWRHYGLRWQSLPASFALAIRLHLMEIPGMRIALRGGRLTETEWT